MSKTPLTLDDIRADIIAYLPEDADDFDNDDNLMDVGLDSMRAMTLVSHWEEKGVPLDFADLAESMTVDGLWAILQERQ
ncbi:MAG: phosphopantetheine-binding protein [Sphingobium sp.]|nr:phosphopantetheine-binding protein [Sphingobium sp.]